MTISSWQASGEGPLAKIYLSSTYSDLIAQRKAVYETLRRLRHDVIAMEDYVATYQRPLGKCLADVASCDLYVGLFAWRYGYVPSADNPEQRSITELEYRKARESGKSCLIFLLKEDADWSPKSMDAVTQENEQGKRIVALRQELSRETTVSFFGTAEELAGLVSTAVSICLAATASDPTMLLRTQYLEQVSKRYSSVKLPIGQAASRCMPFFNP